MTYIAMSGNGYGIAAEIAKKALPATVVWWTIATASSAFCEEDPRSTIRDCFALHSASDGRQATEVPKYAFALHETLSSDPASRH